MYLSTFSMHFYLSAAHANYFPLRALTEIMPNFYLNTQDPRINIATLSQQGSALCRLL